VPPKDPPSKLTATAEARWEDEKARLLALAEDDHSRPWILRGYAAKLRGDSWPAYRLLEDVYFPVEALARSEQEARAEYFRLVANNSILDNERHRRENEAYRAAQKAVQQGRIKGGLKGAQQKRIKAEPRVSMVLRAYDRLIESGRDPRDVAGIVADQVKLSTSQVRRILKKSRRS
jgi:hypothetical protein